MEDEICDHCWYWNTTITDKNQQYRCHGGSCPDMNDPEIKKAKRLSRGWPEERIEENETL
jgi:hypothetical protein